jgi:hypothetical protein
MANHHQNSSLLKVPKILYHTYCWSYPPYPSLSHFSWCYPTNCCIEWPFSIIDIPCYGCSKPATFPPFFNAKGRKASPNGELSSTGHFAPMGLHPLGGAPRIYLWSTSITTGNHQLFMGKKNELNRPYSIANCDLNYQSRQRHPGNCRDPKQPQLMPGCAFFKLVTSASEARSPASSLMRFGARSCELSFCLPGPTVW